MCSEEEWKGFLQSDVNFQAANKVLFSSILETMHILFIAQKNKFSVKDFFSKCEHIHNFA